VQGGGFVGFGDEEVFGGDGVLEEAVFLEVLEEGG
jgi:hypothetical protein